MQNMSNKEKKLRTNIKSAQGSFALVEILAFVYILKTCISKNFDFYFSTFGSQFIMKLSVLSKDYPGSLPIAWTVILTLFYNAIFIAVIIMANKNPDYLGIGLGIYLVDTLWMAVSYSTNYLEPFITENWIDIIVHAIILLFLIVGTDSVKKLKILESKPVRVHRKKKNKKQK